MCSKNKYEKNLAEGFTHGGVFHADDVFAAAVLKILNPDIKIHRGFKIPDDFEGIVFDIGGGEFDHHQKDSRVRENGVPYAAFGLIWERFGAELLRCKEDVDRFDEEFVQAIDQTDNTGEANLISLTIADRNPAWNDTNIRPDDAFSAAVAYAEDILTYRFHQINAERKAYDTVRSKALACRNQILYLEEAMPWKGAICGLDILYVIYPSNRGGYNIQAAPVDGNDRQLKCPFPEQWRGAAQSRLQELTGVDGLTFCHNSGFLCAAQTLEDAYRAAQLSSG